MRTRGHLAVAAVLVAVVVTGVRLFRLDSIQTDLYGDIALVFEYVSRIRAGEWPFYLVTSLGPLYHYLAAPVTLVTGLTYTGLKAASVTISLGVLLATFALARRLVNDSFALLAVTVAGVSSWLLIFSRLGGAPIVVPLLTTCAIWLVVRFARDGRLPDLIGCAVVSGLGVYGYAPSFVLPAVSLTTLAALRWSGHAIRGRDLLMFTGVATLVALPFLCLVWQDPTALPGRFLGGKLRPAGPPLSIALDNTVSAGLAFHVRGDEIFRSNPAGLPHLDSVSGVLFLAGILFWLHPRRRRLAPALLVPFVLLQLPSILVLAQPQEVPSAARTLGVAPVAYLFVASGLYWTIEALKRGARRPHAAVAVASALLVLIAAVNLRRYFQTYMQGLPYSDTSIGREIAAYSDALPNGVSVYIVGERWESSMPEVPFVRLAARHPERVQRLDTSEVSCERLGTLRPPAVLVWSFREALPAAGMETCDHRLPAVLHVGDRGLPVFRAAPLLTADGRPPGVVPAGAPR